MHKCHVILVTYTKDKNYFTKNMFPTFQPVYKIWKKKCAHVHIRIIFFFVHVTNSIFKNFCAQKCALY